MFHVILSLREAKIFFKIGKTIFFIAHDPFIQYFLIIIFLKFDPILRQGWLCVDLGPKCQNLFRFVSD